MRRSLLFIVFVLLLAGPVRSESPLVPPPSDLSPWKVTREELTDSQRWARTLHGIRSTGLHPLFWGYLVEDRTDSRRLVPMRRYYLRSSFTPEFVISAIRLTLKFKKTTEKAMYRFPHTHDPYLDIGFGAEYEVHPEFIRDRGYIARLSAFPGISSGISYFNRGDLVAVSLQKVPPLEVGVSYSAELRFVNHRTELVLNGEKVAESSRSSDRHGAVFLASGWSPVLISDFQAELASGEKVSGVLAPFEMRKK